MDKSETSRSLLYYSLITDKPKVGFIEKYYSIENVNNEIYIGGLRGLHVACSWKNLEFIKILVESKKANIDIPDSSGKTPIHIAVVLENNEEIIKYLIEKGANIEA